MKVRQQSGFSVEPDKDGPDSLQPQEKTSTSIFNEHVSRHMTPLLLLLRDRYDNARRAGTPPPRAASYEMDVLVSGRRVAAETHPSALWRSVFASSQACDSIPHAHTAASGVISCRIARASQCFPFDRAANSLSKTFLAHVYCMQINPHRSPKMT